MAAYPLSRIPVIVPLCEAVWNSCAACGRFRNVWPEEDGTLVCQSCYEERNGVLLPLTTMMSSKE